MTGTIDPAEAVICTIHGNTPSYGGGFARRHPWPVLQMQYLRRSTPPGFKVFAYGHRLIRAHERYLRACPEVEFFSSREIPYGEWEGFVWPIRNWLTRKAAERFRYIIWLDSDAFPVRRDWLERYSSWLNARCPVVAVKRLENGDEFSNQTLLMFTSEGYREHGFDFSPVGVKDVGAAISGYLQEQGLEWRALLRTNRHDFHPLIAGLYDDRIYHHGAGTREPRFRLSKHVRDDARFMRREALVHRELMLRLFDDPDSFIRQLRGEETPFDLERFLRRRVRPRLRNPRTLAKALVPRRLMRLFMP